MTGQPKRIAKPIPDGHHSVTAYLAVSGVAKLIEFVKKAFDARELMRMEGAPGSIAHASVKIGDTIVMMGEPMGKWTAKPCNLYLYVENVDAVYEKALQAGGKSLEAPKDQFYGDRSAGVQDPSGNIWWIATRVEDVSQDEMKRRMQALQAQR